LNQNAYTNIVALSLVVFDTSMFCASLLVTSSITFLQGTLNNLGKFMSYQQGQEDWSIQTN